MGLRENLTRDAVDTLRVLDPVSIDPDSTVAEAIERMQKLAVGCVFVTEHCKPVGVFTERDVLTKVLAKGLPAETPITEVMTRDPRVIGETCSVAEVIDTMQRGGFRHMPVVDGAGHLQGVVSVKRIVEYLVEHFPSAVFNLPPDPVQKQMTREGA